MGSPLEASTSEALEGLGLQQLDSIETCNSAIQGNFLDLLDTTELPSSKVRGTPTLHPTGPISLYCRRGEALTAVCLLPPNVAGVGRLL